MADLIEQRHHSEMAKELGQPASNPRDVLPDANADSCLATRWLTENRQALLSSNAYVEEHGLPLDQYRMF